MVKESCTGDKYTFSDLLCRNQGKSPFIFQTRTHWKADMQKTGDRRIRKTKKAVRDALLALLDEKPLSQITIIELTERADVNRKTFYNHYRDINAVVEEIEDIYADSIIEAMLKAGRIRDLQHFFTALLENLEQSSDIYSFFIKTESESQLIEKLIMREKIILTDLLPPQYSDETWAEYLLTFAVSGTAAAIQKWYESGKEIPKETFAAYFTRLLNAQELSSFIESVQDSLARHEPGTENSPDPH